MKFIATMRDTAKKKNAKRMRRSGQIPAVLYSKGKPTESISIETKEFETLLRQIKQGHLATTIVTLEFGKVQKKAIVKDIQYAPTTYQIQHMDFEELQDDVVVNIKVPITPTGVMECVGIKLGGFLRQVIRAVKVRCLPKDIPGHFEVDIRDLSMHQSRRLGDITMPKGVTPLAKLEEVVVVIAKR
jgi:large subunit ribosomal protein L25